ncbi:hypothetical protein, partial [Alistipes sp.]|uniref:hypothetical protein n=1 Tax=Alistipes sp. TaxID=1872444 RepID=UPI003AAD4375
LFSFCFFRRIRFAKLAINARKTMQRPVFLVFLGKCGGPGRNSCAEKLHSPDKMLILHCQSEPLSYERSGTHAFRNADPAFLVG